MKYPCELIRDLLPLYLDEACSEGSRKAVEEHLAECEVCRQCRTAMGGPDGFEHTHPEDHEEEPMARSLKQVKGRINRRFRRVLAGASAVVIAAALGVVAFSVPLKTVDPADVTVTAEVYPTSELMTESVSGEVEVQITLGEAERGETYGLELPSMPNAEITVSEDVAEQNRWLTTISWSSPYFLREILWAEPDGGQGDTLYVGTFKTTLLNNRSNELTRSIQTLEFQELNQIVFVEKDGSETILWSRAE